MPSKTATHKQSADHMRQVALAKANEREAYAHLGKTDDRVTRARREFKRWEKEKDEAEKEHENARQRWVRTYDRLKLLGAVK